MNGRSPRAFRPRKTAGFFGALAFAVMLGKAPHAAAQSPPPEQAPPAAPPPGGSSQPPAQAPAPGPPQQGYPPQGYPPQGYPPRGYPPQGYPQQGYGQPPPGAYPAPPYGYANRPPPKLRFPEDRAVRTTPFIDGLAGGMALADRYSSFMVLSTQFGTFIAGGLRIAGRFGVFASEADVETYNIEGLPPEFRLDNPERPSMLFGGAVGYALAQSAGFAFSPGLEVLHTDVGSMGTEVGINLPFEWVSDKAMRIGFEFTVGLAVGGSMRATCNALAVSSTAQVPSCDPGEIRDFSRQTGAAYYMGFQLGWGLASPGPVPASAQ